MSDETGSVRTSFQPQRLLLHLEAQTPEDVIRALCAAILVAPGLPADLQASALESAIAARGDAGGALFLAPGFAVLHARFVGVAGVRLALATLARPIDWGAEDHGVCWVALVVAPRERPIQGIRLLGQLQHLFEDETHRGWIDSSTDAEVLAPWLDNRLKEEEGTLTARDLMRPSLRRIGPDMPVPILARLMARYGQDAIGITDDERRLVGQVTADELFRIGMPDFFRQLKSVSFLAEFDPFERYFEKEQSLLARDVMNSNFAALPPDATALEVVFALAVQGFPKVYVVENGRLLGVIDRIRVISRILDL